MTVLAVAGQRVRLRPASAEPVTIIPAVTQRPAGGLPMLVEVAVMTASGGYGTANC